MNYTEDQEQSPEKIIWVKSPLVCLLRTFSKAFEKDGKIPVGWKSGTVIDLSPISTDMILALFHLFGICRYVMIKQM